MEKIKLKIGIKNITSKQLQKDTSPTFVDVLCYFINHDKVIICRVGHWNGILKRWCINSDGINRYYKGIIEWQPIPKMTKEINLNIYSITALPLKESK